MHDMDLADPSWAEPPEAPVCAHCHAELDEDDYCQECDSEQPDEMDLADLQRDRLQDR